MAGDSLKSSPAPRPPCDYLSFICLHRCFVTILFPHILTVLPAILIASAAGGRYILRLDFTDGGVGSYAFTFG